MFGRTEGEPPSNHQAHFQEWLKTEAPLIHAFRDQVTAQTEALREGWISAQEFYVALIGDGQPISAMFRVGL